MKYYSEDTVRKIIRSVAHTALEQMDNFADSALAHQPYIEFPDNHGRLGDLDRVRERLGDDTFICYDCRRLLDDVFDTAPTVLEANR